MFIKALTFVMAATTAKLSKGLFRVFLAMVLDFQLQ